MGNRLMGVPVNKIKMIFMILFYINTFNIKITLSILKKDIAQCVKYIK